MLPGGGGQACGGGVRVGLRGDGAGRAGAVCPIRWLECVFSLRLQRAERVPDASSERLRLLCMCTAGCVCLERLNCNLYRRSR